MSHTLRPALDTDSRPDAAPPVAWWRRLLATPDPALLDAGAEGELAIARVRLALTAVLLLVPLQSLAAGATGDALVGFLSATLAFCAALVVHSIARRGHYRPWMGTTSSLVDVSLVTLGLVVFVIAGDPASAANSRLQFEAYFLAIAATGLRYDRRICIAAGAVAVAQYLAVAAWASSRLERLPVPGADASDVSWATQLSRVVLLVVATALATEAVRRAQRLRIGATRDRLTGLYNRAYVEERGAEELARGARYAHPLALAMLDVDFFKQFNDTHGHAAGDHVLRTVARRLQANLRGTDIVGRFGGEEFVVLFPETSAGEAAERLDAFRALLAAEEATHAGRALGRVTVSAGVSAWPSDGAEVAELVRRADERLYAAKLGGRNRVVAP